MERSHRRRVGADPGSTRGADAGRFWLEQAECQHPEAVGTRLQGEEGIGSVRRAVFHPAARPRERVTSFKVWARGQWRQHNQYVKSSDYCASLRYCSGFRAPKSASGDEHHESSLAQGGPESSRFENRVVAQRTFAIQERGSATTRPREESRWRMQRRTRPPAWRA